MKHTVLVVEDDKGIREAIGIYLRNQGYEALLAENGKEGLQLIDINEIHLAIVDIMMPVMDGMEMVQIAREKHDFPILFLSAKSEEVDKVSGLMLGADDYMTKPFSSMELMARVASLLRRYEQILLLKNQKEKPAGKQLMLRGLQVDLVSHKVLVDGQEVHLTPKEFDIIHLLIEHPGQVFSTDQIYEQVWKEAPIATETVAVHIRKLREKIERDPKNPQYIQAVWGVGYRMKK
jgi:DNA-binding response OmpR family regulator